MKMRKEVRKDSVGERAYRMKSKTKKKRDIERGEGVEKCE